MAKLSNSQIAIKSGIFAIGSYFGWNIFTGINDLIPSVGQMEPIWRILIGLAGLWVLVRLGFRKQD